MTATEHVQPAPALTNRTALSLAPWEPCDVSSKEAPALSMLPGYESTPMSAGWAARHVLRDVAEQHLINLAAPTVGAWASYWKAAGLPDEDLLAVFERITGSWMHSRAQGKYQASTLRHLLRLYPLPPTMPEAKPARLSFAAEDLPTLEALRPARQGQNWPHFVTAQGEKVDILPGRDAVILTLPGEERAVIYTGRRGQVDAASASGFRVPAQLWPLVEDALKGRAPLPTVQAVTVEGEQATVSLSLAGHQWAYRMGRRVDVTVTEPDEDGHPYRVTFHQSWGKDAPDFVQAYMSPDLWATFQAFRHGGQKGG